jgi:hypothetical protein
MKKTIEIKKAYSHTTIHTTRTGWVVEHSCWQTGEYAGRKVLVRFSSLPAGFTLSEKTAWEVVGLAINFPDRVIRKGWIVG